MFCRTHIRIQVENQAKRRNEAKRKTDSRNQISKKEKNGHLHAKLGPSTDVEGAPAHPGTDHTKAVVRRGHQGASTPGVRLHPRGYLLGLASTD
jgi:hypothetical protein